MRELKEASQVDPLAALLLLRYGLTNLIKLAEVVGTASLAHQRSPCSGGGFEAASLREQLVHGVTQCDVKMGVVGLRLVFVNKVILDPCAIPTGCPHRDGLAGLNIGPRFDKDSDAPDFWSDVADLLTTGQNHVAAWAREYN